jgi:hypothetical protein
MSTQMMSDLLVDLSAEEQQFLSGGVLSERNSEDDDESSSKDSEGTRLFRISSTAIVRVRRLR